MKKYMNLDYLLGGLFVVTPCILILASSGGALNEGYLIYSILLCLSAVLMGLHGYRGRNFPYIFLGVVLFGLAIVPVRVMFYLHQALFILFFLGYAGYILLLSRLSDFVMDLLQVLLLVVLVLLAQFDYIAIFDAEVLGLIVIGQHFLFELEK